MSEDTKAIQLAELLLLSGALPGSVSECAAKELRRLHEVNFHLLEALTKLLDEVESDFSPSQLTRNAAHAAIAKATGEKQ